MQLISEIYIYIYIYTFETVKESYQVLVLLLLYDGGTKNSDLIRVEHCNVMDS